MAEKLWNGISGQEFVASRAHKDADGNIIDTTYATKYELSAAISSIPAGAQADWNQTDDTAPDYIKNKPDLEAGEGIDITKNGNTLVFSVSGDYMTSADISDLSAAISGKVDSTTFDNAISEIDSSFADVENDVNDLSGAITDKVDQEVFDNTVTGINSDINYLSGAISSMPTGQVQADWTETDTTSPAYIRNKPTSFDNIQGGDGIEVTKEQDTTIISVSADYATEQYVDAGLAMKMDNSMSGDFYPMDTNPSGYLTSNSLDDYATKDYVIFNTSGKVDTDVFDSTISNIDDNFAIVENDINYLSGSIGDKVDNDTFENVVSDIDSSFGLVESDINYLSAAISSMPAGQVQADWNQTDDTEPDYIKNKPVMEAGEGIDITENGNTLVFSVSGDYATSTDISKLSDRIDDKLDTSAFNNKVSEIDNNFIVVESDIDDLSGAISDKVDVDTFDDAITDITNSFDDVASDINYLSGAVSNKVDSEVFDSVITDIDNSFNEVENDVNYLSGAITDKVDTNVFNDTISEIDSGITSIENDMAEMSAAIANKVDTNVFNDTVMEIDDSFGAVEDDINYLSAAISSMPTEQVQSDWSETDITSPAYIQNKPESLAITEGSGIKIVENQNNIEISVSADYAYTSDVNAAIDAVEDEIDVVSGAIDDINTDLQNYVSATEFAEVTAVIPSDATSQNQLVSMDTLDSKIADFGGFKVVSANQQGEPDVSNPETNIIYLTQDPQVVGKDQFKEWIWDSNAPAASAWKLVGDTSIDLEGYVKAPQSYTPYHIVSIVDNNTLFDTGLTTATITNTRADWNNTDPNSYAYIQNKPVIPAAQVQADWNMADSADISYIKNKPTSLSIQGGEGIEVSENQDALVIAVSADYATENYVDTALDSKLDVSMSAEFYPMNTNPAGYVTSADLNYYATETYVDAAVSGKVDAIVGMGLSHEDFTSAYKEKLDSISPSAEANVQADWEEIDPTSDSYIVNKPDPIVLSAGPNVSITETDGKIVIGATVPDVTGKADKVANATAGNFVSLSADGNLIDSTYSPASFATAAQGALADTSIQGVTVDNSSPLTPTAGVVNIDLSGKVDKVTGKGLSTNDYTNADKAVVDNASDVIPSDADTNNQLVSYNTMTAALANFIGMKISTGTGTDMHPDEQNPNTKTIYLVYDSSVTGGDKYKEWIYSTTNTWTLIGDTTVDLSGYVQYPSTHTDTHLVAFGPNDSIADTGKTIADLTNTVETVSIGSGTGISPTMGTTDINIPLATNVNNVGTDGAMAGGDKVKLDGIEVGAEVNAVNTISIGSGSSITPTTGTTDINIPIASSSVDGAMASSAWSKLDGIEAGAQVNVKPDWNAISGTSAEILNKPDIIIPQDSPSAQGGISAPKYLMVVSAMPPAAQIDPDTIYLVQGTYIGT